jgi:glycopeptide antibiotics resistance protein
MHHYLNRNEQTASSDKVTRAPGAQPIAVLLILASIVLVLTATLIPFTFRFQETLSSTTPYGLLRRFLTVPSTLWDVLSNVLLFIPLGFGLGMLLQHRPAQKLPTIVQAMLFGAALSAFVELLQVFLPTRTPTYIDILTNSAGTALGWQLRQRTQHFIPSPRVLTLALGAYMVLVLFVSLHFQNATSLNNWERSFPLAVGNEQGGNRPWRGQIAGFQVLDQAVTDEALLQELAIGTVPEAVRSALVANFRSDGTVGLRDSTGQQPDLVWQQPITAGQSDAQVVTTTAEQWLSSEVPAEDMSRVISEASQLTLVATVATADTGQDGPARIISLSNGTLERNFTLGQQGPDLIFRLRTVGTGGNGALPYFIASNVFADTNTHNLIVTYDGSTIRLYVDGEAYPYSLQLTPELTAIATILPTDTSAAIGPHLMSANNRLLLQLAYYSFICAPGAALLVMIAWAWRSRGKAV